MTTPLALAKTILRISDWKITHLSVQKILYFCHMFYMGKYDGSPLVEEEFEAWAYGPILPSLYEDLKIFGGSPITSFYKVDEIKDDKIIPVLEEVAGTLGKKEAWQLVSLTHSKEGAWAKYYTPKFHRKIPNGAILKEYERFKQKTP